MRLASEDPRGFERFTGDQAFLRRWWFAAGALIAALGVLGVLLASR
jgi:hypothetical protein